MSRRRASPWPVTLLRGEATLGWASVLSPDAGVGPVRGEIGVPRFELGTSPTRTERATRLRHTPNREHRLAEVSMHDRRAGVLHIVHSRQPEPPPPVPRPPPPPARRRRRPPPPGDGRRGRR